MAKAKRPYKLPTLITCSADEIANGISYELVKKCIDKHREMLLRYEYLENLYKGFHDIFKAPEKPEWKPDNRLAVNFPRYMTDTFIGFGYGIPIKVSHEDEGINEAIQNFCKDNEITDHESEMAKKCCIYGHAWEYIYQNEEAKTKVTAFSPKELFVIYDDTVKNKGLFAVRYGRHGEDHKNKGELYGEILSRSEIEYFDAREKIGSEPNPYGYIPVVEWGLNDERMGLYESVTNLIETYNSTLGEKANDVEAFAEAYLAIIGAEIDEKGLYKIRDNRLINLYGTDDAKEVLIQFLQKPTADGTQENLLDRLETLIYQTSMVANISDDSFGNSTSGVALAYKLQAMSNLALSFDRKIEKSLRKRYKIFCSLSTNVPDRNAYIDVGIKMTRNLPKNYKEEAETAQALSGIVSQETQLKGLSIISDPTAEIEKIKAEEAEQLAGAADDMFKKNRGSTYEVTSLLRKYKRGELTRNNAIRMFAVLGMTEEEAIQLMDDRDEEVI